MHSPEIVFIVGPTAVGKTEVALTLAQSLSGEIINADAMQVYREISVANNKPSLQALASVPHHLFGVISVRQSFDVAVFYDMALAAVRTVQARGNVPIVAGGSGMYIRVLLDGIFDQGKKKPAIRRRLEQELSQSGSQALHARLKEVDPAAAHRIHANDGRRIIRALEVFETLEQPISSLQGGHGGLWGQYRIRLFGLQRERHDLYERINRRVDEMVEDGLIAEMKRLEFLALSRTAESIIGVREIRGYLRGEYDLDHAKDLMRLHTRHYAKRQMTWFRKEHRLEWMPVRHGQTAAHVAGDIQRDITQEQHENGRG